MRDERGLAARAAPRLLRERESQLEGLERDGRFRAAQRSRNAGLGHRAGEGLQLAEVVLAPRAGRAGARAGRSRGGALGSSGHEGDLSDARGGRIVQTDAQPQGSIAHIAGREGSIPTSP